MADHNKTEQPTPHRRDKARKQGQVARSRDLSSALALAGAGLALYWQGGDIMARWGGFLRRSLSLAVSQPITLDTPLLWWSSVEVLRGITPVLLAGAMLATAAGVAQGGMVFAGDALVPKLERLSPANKLKQMFSLTSLSGLLKSLLPFAAILAVGVQALQTHWGEMVRASYLSLHAFGSLVLSTVLEVGWKSALILLAWSGVDYLLNWQKMEGDLRMSRQEVREDIKETEGSPETKGRIRKIQRSLRRRQALRATETATVVVTNPTHYAVALRYELEMEAPVVVAKGRNLLAQRIKEVARWQGIPIMENPPLAQALYRAVEVGQSIPAKLYTAVAEILVLVFRAQAKVRNPQDIRPERVPPGPGGAQP
jgi:flagellar biosynthesis protein FlhB